MGAGDLTLLGRMAMARPGAEEQLPRGAAVPAADGAWHEVSVPMRFLYAQWSTGIDSSPAYSHERVEEYRRAAPNLVDVRYLPGADHAGTIMTKDGATATAELLLEALG